jgi:flavin-binding protein dodecin
MRVRFRIFRAAFRLNLFSPKRRVRLGLWRSAEQESDMASADQAVYRVTEIVGTSTTSWEDAAKHAVETAAKSLRDLRVAEVEKLDMKVEDGKIVAYRARVSLSFKYEG